MLRLDGSCHPDHNRQDTKKNDPVSENDSRLDDPPYRSGASESVVAILLMSRALDETQTLEQTHLPVLHRQSDHGGCGGHHVGWGHVYRRLLAELLEPGMTCVP